MDLVVHAIFEILMTPRNFYIQTYFLKKNCVPQSKTQDFLATFWIWVYLRKISQKMMNFAAAKFENSSLWGLYH